MEKKPWEWTEEDLRTLIGQAESIRLEFKSSKLFEENQDKVRDTLSKETSAFANSEGGTIVIGMEEVGRKNRIANGIDDGVDINQYSREWLQQIIESNISPHLPGIRVHVIKLSGKEGRVAYVIHIPQGSTAYQAKDKRYYCRSEYEVNPMPDHEIRMRMMKGLIAQARIEISNVEQFTAEEENRKSKEGIRWSEENGVSIPDRLPDLKFYDELKFQLKIINTGEITIKDFLLTVKADTELDIISPIGHMKDMIEDVFRFDKGKWSFKSEVSESIPPENKIFPHQEMIFPEGKWSTKIPIQNFSELKDKKCILYWTVYLDNAPPCRGEIHPLSEILF